MLDRRQRIATHAALFPPARRIHLARRAQFLPNESIRSEGEIKNRATVGEQNHRPYPRQRRSRRLIPQKNVRNRRPRQQIPDPDNRPMHRAPALLIRVGAASPLTTPFIRKNRRFSCRRLVVAAAAVVAAAVTGGRPNAEENARSNARRTRRR